MDELALKMNDAEIELMAEHYASEKVPKPSYTLSVNKCDLKRGFIDGMKKMKELYLATLREDSCVRIILKS